MTFDWVNAENASPPCVKVYEADEETGEPVRDVAVFYPGNGYDAQALAVELVGRLNRAAWAAEDLMPPPDQKPGVMLYVGGSKLAFRCSCGCNVFTRAPDGGQHYYCNSCRSYYSGD